MNTYDFGSPPSKLDLWFVRNPRNNQPTYSQVMLLWLNLTKRTQPDSHQDSEHNFDDSPLSCCSLTLGSGFWVWLARFGPGLRETNFGGPAAIHQPAPEGTGHSEKGLWWWIVWLRIACESVCVCFIGIAGNDVGFSDLPGRQPTRWELFFGPPVDLMAEARAPKMNGINTEFQIGCDMMVALSGAENDADLARWQRERTSSAAYHDALSL